MVKGIIFFEQEPRNCKDFQQNNICHNCAWTIGRSTDPNGVGFYYCYYFDKKFSWEIDKPSNIGYRLKMTPCLAFHSVPPPQDMNRGAVFAKYFQNKRQIETSTRLSCYSIIIAVVSVLIALGGLLVSCNNSKQNSTSTSKSNEVGYSPTQKATGLALEMENGGI